MLLQFDSGLRNDLRIGRAFLAKQLGEIGRAYFERKVVGAGHQLLNAGLVELSLNGFGKLGDDGRRRLARCHEAEQRRQVGLGDTKFRQRFGLGLVGCALRPRGGQQAQCALLQQAIDGAKGIGRACV